MFGKIIKRMLKWFGIVVAALAGLLVAYVVYNTPFATKYKDLSADEMHNYTTYLDTHISDPFQFVSEKFKSHDVILIGEVHRRRQDVEFVKSLIPYLYAKNGITIIAWEFGASDFQREADSLLSAPQFDERKAISLMRRQYWEWDLQEYVDVYKVIWDLNQTIPSGKEKIRLLHLGSDFNERKLDSADPKVRREEIQRYMYDKKMADIIEREVLIPGKKALWYSGLHHAFTKFRQPKIFFMTVDGPERRGGNYLYDKYANRVYLISLHFPAPGRWVVLGELMPSQRDLFWKFYYPFQGVIDKVYMERKRAFAFDARDSPFGDLKDNYSYYSFDHWGPILLKNFCDGYIIPCSFEEAEPARPVKNWVSTPAEWEEVKQRMLPTTIDRYKDPETFMKAMEEQIPRLVKWAHTIQR